MPAESVQKKLTQLRELIRDAMPEQASRPGAEVQAQRAFHLYEFNSGMAPLEQSPRARAEREIHRIAMTYGWQGEVARALDGYGAASLAGLEDGAVDQLLAHMQKLLDRAMNACDHDEVLPAR